MEKIESVSEKLNGENKEKSMVVQKCTYVEVVKSKCEENSKERQHPIAIK